MRTIAERALRMLGTPFRHQGRQPGVGVDCLGLVVCAIGGRALELDECDYAELPDGERLSAALEAHFAPLPVDYADDAPTGAVLAFRAGRESHPRHLAIRTDAGMVHARRGDRRGVVEVGLDGHWNKVFVGAWAWPDQHSQ